MERHQAVLVFERVEQAQLLIAVRDHRRRIHVQHHHFRRRRKRIHVLIHEGITEAQEGASIHGVLQAGHRGLRRQVRVPLRIAPDGRLEHRIMAEMVAIVRVFVPGHDLQNALPQHGADPVDHLPLLAPVRDAACQPVDNAQIPLYLRSQQNPSVRRHGDVLELRRDLLAGNPRENQLLGGILIHAWV
ncbi:MAG: hypothetical protein WCG36_06220 [bacterium]